MLREVGDVVGGVHGCLWPKGADGYGGTGSIGVLRLRLSR